MVMMYLLALALYSTHVISMDKSELECVSELYYMARPHSAASEEQRFFCAKNAAYRCDMKQLRALVGSANVNRVDEQGYPVLFQVIDRGFDDASAPIKEPIEFLADLGANLDQYSYNQKMSALEYATQKALITNKTLAPLTHLLEQGVDPFCQNPGRPRSPFQLAYNNHRCCDRALQIVLLFRAYIKNLHHAVIAHDLHKTSAYVASCGASPLDYRNKTPLYYAITHYNSKNRDEMLPILQILLNNGANPNAVIEESSCANTTHFLRCVILSLVRGDTSMIPHFLMHRADPFERKPLAPSAYDFSLFSFMLDKNQADQLVKKHPEESRSQFKIFLDRILKNKTCALEMMALFNKWGKPTL